MLCVLQRLVNSASAKFLSKDEKKPCLSHPVYVFSCYKQFYKRINYDNY